MLPANLTTNEIKNSAGTEVEFLRQSLLPRGVIFAKSGESPSLIQRLTVSHQESGSGIRLVRRSLARVDYSSLSQVDLVTPITDTVYCVTQTNVGHHTDYVVPTHAMAYLLSFMASLGASTTILYDGTGNGAAALINGSL
jgi:hypothetical protein